jgi:hypothetical protein
MLQRLHVEVERTGRDRRIATLVTGEHIGVFAALLALRRGRNDETANVRKGPAIGLVLRDDILTNPCSGFFDVALPIAFAQIRRSARTESTALDPSRETEAERLHLLVV